MHKKFLKLVNLIDLTNKEITFLTCKSASFKEWVEDVPPVLVVLVLPPPLLLRLPESAVPSKFAVLSLNGSSRPTSDSKLLRLILLKK